MNNLACAGISLPKALSRVILVAGVVFSPPALAQGSSIPYGGGAGSAQKFERFNRDRDAFAQTGQVFRIEGHCQSACTLFLKLRNVCIDPNAELLFHAGGSAHSTQVMLDSYNGKLRSFFNGESLYGNAGIPYDFRPRNDSKIWL